VRNHIRGHEAEFTARWLAGEKVKALMGVFGFRTENGIRKVRARLGLPPRHMTAYHERMQRRTAA
jgi:hypothetical protein